jgi:hypothetical protein
LAHAFDAGQNRTRFKGQGHWGMFGPTVALDGKDLVLFVTTLSVEKGRPDIFNLKPGERVGIGLDNRTVYGGIGRATARFSN